MAQKRKPHLRTSVQVAGVKRRKEKGKTQTPPMESYMHVGPTGKKTMRKRPW